MIRVFQKALSIPDNIMSDSQATRRNSRSPQVTRKVSVRFARESDAVERKGSDATKYLSPSYTTKMEDTNTRSMKDIQQTSKVIANAHDVTVHQTDSKQSAIDGVNFTEKSEIGIGFAVKKKSKKAGMGLSKLSEQILAFHRYLT